MNADEHAPPSYAAARQASGIRKQATWAAISAAILLYFGMQGFVSTEEAAFATRILEFTLKAGGCAMALAAVLLMTGMPFALLYDGVMSMLIGAGLGLAAVALFVGVGSIEFSGVFQLIFGYFFISSGRRSWQEYTAINPLFVSADGQEPAHGRADPDSGVRIAGFPSWQRVEGRGEAGLLGGMAGGEGLT